MDPLEHILEIVKESGVLASKDYRYSKKNRKELLRYDPEAFLDIKGIPTFGIRKVDGSISLSLLKRSLSAAKSNFSKTKKCKYKNYAKKIGGEIQSIISKTNRSPISYKTSLGIKDLLKSFLSLPEKEKI